MLVNYLHTAMRQASYGILADDQSFYGEIPVCKCVHVNASTLEACRKELMEVLEEWVLFRIQKNLTLPVIDGVALPILSVGGVLKMAFANHGEIPTPSPFHFCLRDDLP